MATAALQNPRYEAHENPLLLTSLGYGLPVQPHRLRHPAGHPGHRGQSLGTGRLLPHLDGLRLTPGLWSVHDRAGPSARPGRRRRRLAHVHRHLRHSVLHYGRGGRRAGHAHCVGPGFGGSPARHLQVALYSAAIRYANRGRHGDDDPLHHPGVGRFRTSGRRVGGRTRGGPADRAGNVGHRGRVGSAWIRAVASLGADDRNRRRLRRCRYVRNLQLRPSRARALDRAAAVSPWVGTRLRPLLLDAAARLSVPRAYHFDSGQRRGDRRAAGVMA